MAAPEPFLIVPADADGSAESGPSRVTEPVAERLVRYMRTGTLALAALPPLSIYVHLPWCLRKCPYCDFNSHGIGPAFGGVGPALGGVGPAFGGVGPAFGSDTSGRSTLDPGLEARYVDALLADLEASLPFVWGRRVKTVFLGGGTPSLFTPASIERLLEGLRARLPIEPDAEITMEANPGSFERDRFRGYRDAGVNRLSIGVQSFDDAALAALGRVHDARQAIAAIEEAQDAFATWNLDLMYALPGQTPAAFDAELATALGFAPPHLSLYHLTIEPNTWFAKHPPRLPDDDSAYDMLDLAIERTGAAGLERYEVSAFARAGHRCAHNLNYWQFGDYLGLGAGAHGKLSFAHRIVRQVRFREPGRYMERALAGQAVWQEQAVPRRELPFEFMLNATRLRDGFDRARFVERTGLPASAIAGPLDDAVGQGLIEINGDIVRPTPRGFDFLNDLQALFLPS